MLLTATTSKPVDQLRESLPQACAAHGFGVLGVHDLRAKLKEKGQDYDHPCLVFDVCNPVQARRVLMAEPSVSAVLPCRISAFEDAEGHTRLVTVRPTRMIELFAGAGLEEVAREVETTLEAILSDVAAG
ncbi:MAG: DUF302 domain-containing protein [Planctomycetota bacterium]|jgi:uncharacterized protein (DUF302 family)